MPSDIAAEVREALEREYQCAVDDCPSCEHNVDRSLAAVLPILQRHLESAQPSVPESVVELLPCLRETHWRTPCINLDGETVHAVFCLAALRPAVARFVEGRVQDALDKLVRYAVDLRLERDKRNREKLRGVPEAARLWMLEVVSCDEALGDDGLCDCAREHFDVVEGRCREAVERTLEYVHLNYFNTNCIDEATRAALARGGSDSEKSPSRTSVNRLLDLGEARGTADSERAGEGG